MKAATVSSTKSNRKVALGKLAAEDMALTVASEAASAVLSNIAFDTALPAPSTDIVSELNNIDFQKMIGGPLQACVNAQVASSLASVDFIKTIGFKEVDGKSELVMVDFSHERNDVKADGTADKKTVNVKVPLIAMVQIPSLRIEFVEINFNVKINSVETATRSTTLGATVDVSGGWGPVKFKVSGSAQRSSSTGIKVEKEYLLNVKVRAVQDEMPAGLEKIFGLLSA